MTTLILPIGCPGCGKTWWCENVLSQYGIGYVSSDDIRAELYGDARIQGNFSDVFDIVYNRAKKLMRQDGVVCIDATNVSKFARGQAILRVYPQRIIYVIMNNDISRAKKQNKMRERYCPERVINDMAKKLRKEPPQNDKYGAEIYCYDDPMLLEVLEELRVNG